MRRSLLVLALAITAACGKSPSGRAACGLAALAGPTALLTQFSIPGQTLSRPPERLPERLVARLVAGPALPAVVGRANSSLVVGIEGGIPSTIKPGYGILVVDQAGKVRGLMVYEGLPVDGAPQIGTITVGAATMPLIGIQLDPAKVEDPNCPLFPDSVLA
jgi:hypothetical protein